MTSDEEGEICNVETRKQQTCIKCKFGGGLPAIANLPILDHDQITACTQLAETSHFADLTKVRNYFTLDESRIGKVLVIVKHLFFQIVSCLHHPGTEVFIFTLEDVVRL